VFLQVFEMCFTLSTFRDCEAPDELVELLELGFVPPLGVAAELLPEGVPVISTSCPTCLSSFEVSPESWYVVPASDVNV
jgi:hypothetical protein